MARSYREHSNSKARLAGQISPMMIKVLSNITTTTQSTQSHYMKKLQTRKFNTLKSTNRTHLCTIITLLMLFCNFVLSMTNKEESEIQTTTSITVLQNMHSRALYLNCKRKSRLNRKTAYTHLKLTLLLLILSNDINPNPGPHSEGTNPKTCENCTMCNLELKNIENVL